MMATTPKLHAESQRIMAGLEVELAQRQAAIQAASAVLWDTHKRSRPSPE